MVPYFSLNWQFWVFWTKFAQKCCFWSKTEKENTIIEFYIFELVQVTNTSLNWQFWFFEPNLSKWSLRWKLKQVNIAIELCIFELVYVPNFSWNWQFCFFGPSLPKKGYLQSKTEKLNKHHHLILHIRIRLRTKFQLKLVF